MNAAMKILARRALKNRPEHSNSQNPYRETVTEVVNGRRKTIRRDRPMPEGISPNDQEVLKRVRRKAYKWDQQFRCCCFGVRFGWSAILGLIPVIGDGLELLMSLSLIRTASKVDGGLPKRIYSLMITYIILDFAFGFIPVLGDFVDFTFRANTRNAWLLDSYLTEKGKVLGPGIIKDEEDNDRVIPVPDDLRSKDQDVEQGVEPMHMVEPSSRTPTAVPPARTPAPRAMPPPGRNLTRQGARDPRDR